MGSNRHRKYLLGTILGIVLTAGRAAAQPVPQNTAHDTPQEPRCPVVQETLKRTLAARVRTRFQTDSAATVQLADDSLVAGSCYHRLIFEIESGQRVSSLPLYLSPDQRYLTRDLVDLRANDSVASAGLSLSSGVPPVRPASPAPSEVASAKLMEGAVAVSGELGAPSTLVIFSDFQCPYCKRSAEWLRAETGRFDAKQLRIAYRFYPLSFHAWARPSAEAAACVATQSPAAFWTFHDAIFANQKDINPENVQSKLLEYAQAIEGLNISVYQKCVGGGESAGIVQRDQALGNSVQVRGTPTVFVNGKQLALRSPEQLRAALEEAVRGNKAVRAAITR